MIALFVLTVVLQAPQGQQRFEYPAVPLDKCERMRADETVRAEQLDYALISSRCEPAPPGAYVLTVALEMPNGQTRSSATVKPNIKSCQDQEKTIASAFATPQGGYTLRKTECRSTNGR